MTLFQDGWLHHCSDSWYPLNGNMGHTSQFGSVNKGRTKWKHNTQQRSELDLYGGGTVLPIPCNSLLQTPTLCTRGLLPVGVLLSLVRGKGVDPNII